MLTTTSGPYFIDYFDNPTRAQVGTMVAILEVGAFISSLVVGRVGDIIGRRKTIMYGSMIFFTGGALQSFATGMTIMMLGRIIAGVGVGMLSTIVPVYQSEISPPHNRGKLACIEFSGNIIGYTSSVWVDYFCGYINSNLSWRIPLLMQCVMGALLGLGSLIIVESPRWLLDNDHDEEGIVVIANLYGGGDIHNPAARDEFRDIKMSVLIGRAEGERSYAEMFRRYKKRVLIAMSAQALAQLNGINVISYYAPYVFESAGWHGHDAILMTGINGITYFLSTIPPWYIVDRWGRRVILLTGAVAMSLSLCTISYFIFLDIKSTPVFVVAFVMIYNAAFGYSWGPIPWLYPPEILPLSIRSKGASLSTATNWAFNWLVGEMTPVLQEWIKWRLYLVHAFFCALSFVVGKSSSLLFCYPRAPLTLQCTSFTPKPVAFVWRTWTRSSVTPARRPVRRTRSAHPTSAAMPTKPVRCCLLRLARPCRRLTCVRHVASLARPARSPTSTLTRQRPSPTVLRAGAAQSAETVPMLATAKAACPAGCRAWVCFGRHRPPQPLQLGAVPASTRHSASAMTSRWCLTGDGCCLLGYQLSRCMFFDRTTCEALICFLDAL